MKRPANLLFKSILIALFSPLTLFGQNVEIETTSLQIVDKKLQIQYDFLKSKKTHRFEVWVEISTLSGKKINSRTFNGDIGEGVKGGRGKMIIWDYNADGIVLNEELNVDIKANISVVSGAVKPLNSLAKSLVLPGWGLSSMDKGKPYWLMGLAAYASLGTSLYLSSSYKNNYDKYKVTVDPDESNELFNKSVNQKSLSKTFTYTAIGIWAVSAIWTVVKANKTNNALAYTKQKQLLFYSSYDPVTKSTGFTLKFNF